MLHSPGDGAESGNQTPSPLATERKYTTLPYLIYKIGNTVNNKLYIGITNQTLKTRWSGHYGDAIKRNKDKPLYRDMRLYGADKFFIETIEEHCNEDTAHHRELYWMRMLSTIYPQGYNLRSPLTNAEAAIVKYNAWDWTSQQYADFFGLCVGSVRLIQTTSCWGSYRHITKEHLPASYKVAERGKKEVSSAA